MRRKLFVALLAMACCSAVGATGASAATTMLVRGTVSCSQGKAPVAIWVASSGGGSGLVGNAMWRFASKGANGSYAYFEKTISSKTSKSTINVHVGCGGSWNDWGKDLWSADYPNVGAGGKTINLACNYSKKEYVKGACTSAPKGISLGTNPKSNPYKNPNDKNAIKYCTGGAVQFWFNSAKYWPKVNRSVKNAARKGDAKLMDDNARDNGFRVLPVPAVRSMVVFNNVSKWGHVGWVTRVYKKNGKPVFDYMDRNGANDPDRLGRTSDFGDDRMRYGKAWDSATQAFIVTPN